MQEKEGLILPNLYCLKVFWSILILLVLSTHPQKYAFS